MESNILTISFDPEREAFATEELEDFCINKKIHSLREEFFMYQSKPFWTIFIQFERVVEREKNIEVQLSEPEKLLFRRLKGWRKEKASQEGLPAYMVASNQHLVEMVKRRVRTLAGFDSIKSFGKKRIEKYGKEIITLVQKFEQNEQGK
ncbi:MAG: HRDC domain-containing protein [Bacteroidetes bacterium]|nr:HRDC domain-containing protein [Bacteroidota bacterium]